MNEVERLPTKKDILWLSGYSFQCIRIVIEVFDHRIKIQYEFYPNKTCGLHRTIFTHPHTHTHTLVHARIAHTLIQLIMCIVHL